MILTTCLRRLNTCKRLGFTNSMRILKERHKTYTFNRTWRKKYTKTIDTLGKPCDKPGDSPAKLYAKMGHTWHDIAQQQGCTPSFEQFFNQQCARSLPVLEPLFASITDDEYKRRADEYVRNEFAILGSEKRVFDSGIPWHEDIRLTGQDASSDAQFDATSWYADIRIGTNTEALLGKDIKVPWELSRLRQIVVLGCAYTTTYDERYATAFEEQVRSWMTANPFLRGINWVCPMEVALRATSLVLAFASFRRSPVISDEFWLGYVTNLYDHMIYLENNWELYDLRTSNHYIADLVGYLYLCWFFNDCPAMAHRIAWCHQELLAELNKQINPDGSSYEQTTAYHRLVTELFYHHQLIAQQLRLPMSEESQEKFSAMCSYIQWCTPAGGELITIGDNDSGVVTVAGLPQVISESFCKSMANSTENVKKSQANSLEQSGLKITGLNRQARKNTQTDFDRLDPVYVGDGTEIIHTEQQQSALRHFEHAGLSIIKTDSWHVSLRHSVHNQQEPTCHMHNDATSITLGYNGVPFIVDPGSYVYTPSVAWRNLFRSVQSHSGIYLARLAPTINRNDPCEKPCPGVIPAQAGIQASRLASNYDKLQPIEPVALDDNIFLLRRNPAIMSAQDNMLCSEGKLSMRTTHDDYLNFGCRPERRVSLDEQVSTVTLHDQWFFKDPTTKNHKSTARGNSTSSPVSGDSVHSPLYAGFQFVLHPDVKATEIIKPGSSGNNAIWLLESVGITLELASDQLVYELRPTWYSPEYGVKVATQMLFARYELNNGDMRNQVQQFHTIFSLVSEAE